MTLAKNNLPVRVYEKLDQGVGVIGKAVCWTEEKLIDGYKAVLGKENLHVVGEKGIAHVNKLPQ